MPGPDDLYAACVNLLQTAAACLATTSQGVPAWAGVTPPMPSYDCPQMLAVWWGPVTSPDIPSDTSRARPPHAWLNMVQFTILVIRCAAAVPDGGFPNPVAINTQSAVVSADAWALSHGIPRAAIADTLFGDYPCREVILGSVQQISEQGGAIGCTMTLTARIDGYA